MRNPKLTSFIGLSRSINVWEYSNAGQSSLAADFDNSLCVDTNDLKILADFWLNGSPNETNLENLTALCENWLYGTNQ